MRVPIEQINDSEERRFIKNIDTYYRQSEKQCRPFFTAFHNKEWMQSVIERYGGADFQAVSYYFGGYENAERQLLGISPYEIEVEDFPLVILEIKVKTGIGKNLTHRDFLGALLGLGIEREMIGDILIKPFGAYVMVNETMADYIGISLTGIGRYQNIEINPISYDLIEIDPPQIKVLDTTVASLRLDVIVSTGFNLSRGNAMKLIKSERVKCNGIIGNASQLLKEGDQVTVRGCGKIALKTVNGYTKKERLHITIEKYI